LNCKNFLKGEYWIRIA